MRSSRLGGVPTSLPDPGESRPGQLALGLAGAHDTTDITDTTVVLLASRTARPLPDVVHVQEWLTANEQRRLVEQFRQWALPRPGFGIRAYT